MQPAFSILVIYMTLVLGQKNYPYLLKMNLSSLEIDNFDYATIFCDKCDYSCRRKDQIKLHQATKHEGFRFKCTKCEKEFLCVTHRNRHIRLEHEGFRFQCDQCDYAAKTKPSLQRHTDVIHKKIIMQFSCTKCAKLYKHNKDLVRHIRTNHDKIGLKCDKCPYVAHSKSRLNEHNRKHENERPTVIKPEKIKHPCEKCGEEFRTKMKLALHVGAAHFSPDEKYPCHLCGLEANSKRVLKNHIIDHMKKKPKEVN